MPGPCPDGLFFLLFGGVIQKNRLQMRAPRSRDPTGLKLLEPQSREYCWVSSNHSFIGSFGSRTLDPAGTWAEGVQRRATFSSLLGAHG